MKKVWIAFMGAILVVSGITATQRVSASQAHSPSAAAAGKLTGCDGKGTVSYMYWGDKGDNAAHLASIKVAEKDCKGLHVTPSGTPVTTTST